MSTKMHIELFSEYLFICRYSLIRNSNQPTMKDLDVAFQGNLCRCTGYRPIIEGTTENWLILPTFF